MVDAKKEVINGQAAWDLVAGAEKVFVASGKNILEFDPAVADREELLKKVTGRTGNLRAPALKHGDILYVGYNTELYDNLI